MTYPGGFYPGQENAYPGFTGAPRGPAATAPRQIPPLPALATVPVLDEWSFGLGPRGGGITDMLPQGTGHKLSIKLTEPSEASIDVDGRDPIALLIDELATDLHVLHRPTPGAPRQQVYRGRIGKASDRGTEDTHRVTVPSLDYRAVLARRRLFPGHRLTWSQTEQTAIGWGLVAGTQAQPGGDLGIVDASTATGVRRDRTWEVDDEIGASIDDVAHTLDGFDWDIVAVDERRLEFRTWYPSRGSLRATVEVDLGGSARAFGRTVDSGTYANALLIKGKAPDGGGAEPAPLVRAAPDITTAPEGRWEAMVTTEATTATALAERADWTLADARTVRPSYTFSMKRGWWQGPSHCWVGDGVMVRLRSGRLQVDEVMRIYQMDITPDPNGGAALELTVNAPPPDPRRRAVDILRRLDALERR